MVELLEMSKSLTTRYKPAQLDKINELAALYSVSKSQVLRAALNTYFNVLEDDKIHKQQEKLRNKPELEFEGLDGMQGSGSHINVYHHNKRKLYDTVTRSLHPRSTWWAVKYNGAFWPCWINSRGQKCITIGNLERRFEHQERFLVR